VQSADAGKLALDLVGASEGFAVDGDSSQAVEFIAERVVVGGRSCGVKDLHAHLLAETHLIGGQRRQPLVCHLRFRRVVPCAGVNAEHHHCAGRVWASNASD
jgi:hypothetical protein